MTALQTLDAFGARVRSAVAAYGMRLLQVEHGQDHGAELDAHLGVLDQIVEEAFAAGVESAVAARDRITGYYVPVTVPWRCVRAREVVVDYPPPDPTRPDEQGDPDLWAVERSGWVIDLESRERAWGLTIVGVGRQRIAADPDDRIDVLMHVGLLDAVTLSRERLGAALIATRTSEDGTTDGDPAWRAEQEGHRQGTTTTIGGP